jgi:hypothetical protein
MSYWRDRVCRTAPIPRWLAHGIDALLLTLLTLAVVVSLTEVLQSDSVVVSRYVDSSRLLSWPRSLAITFRAPPGSFHTLRLLRNARQPNGSHVRRHLFCWSPSKVFGRIWTEMRDPVVSDSMALTKKVVDREPIASWHPAAAAAAKAFYSPRIRLSGNGGPPGDGRLVVAFTLFLVGTLLALYIIGLCGSLRKCGYAAWYGVMPFTGALALCESGGNVWLWVLPKLFTNPPFSTTANAIICYGLAVSFVGKREHHESRGLGARPSQTSIWDDFTWRAFWLTAGLVFLPFITFPLVALNDSMQYDACYRARLAERVVSSDSDPGEYVPLP